MIDISTTKSDKVEHGIGLESVLVYCRKISWNGRNQRKKESIFSVTVFMYKLNNVWQELHINQYFINLLIQMLHVELL